MKLPADVQEKSDKLEGDLAIERRPLRIKLVKNPATVEMRDPSVRFKGVTLHLTKHEHKTLLAFAALKDAFLMDALRDAGIREEIVRGLQADPRHEDEVMVSARVSLFKRGRQLTDRYVWSPDIVGFLYQDSTTVDGINTGATTTEADMSKVKKSKGTSKRSKSAAAPRAWNRTYTATGKTPDPAPGEGTNMDKVLKAASKRPQSLDDIVKAARIETKQDKRQQVMIMLQKLAHRGAIKIERSEDTPAAAPKKTIRLKKKSSAASASA